MAKNKPEKAKEQRGAKKQLIKELLAMNSTVSPSEIVDECEKRGVNVSLTYAGVTLNELRGIKKEKAPIKEDDLFAAYQKGQQIVEGMKEIGMENLELTIKLAEQAGGLEALKKFLPSKQKE